MPHTAPAYASRYVPLLHAAQPTMLSRLETLVNLDSGTGQVEGINVIIEWLAQWMSELGFMVTLYETVPFGNNLVARLRGNGDTRIVLVGHVDTVYTAGSVKIKPFSLHEGIAYGPGGIDMKSGVVMGIAALRALLETGFDQFGELCFFINNDEEVGSPGSTPLLHDLAASMDVGLVLEPARAPEVLTKARKGSDKYMLK
jgi:glutamate carboxypeptidase